jgi:hypothetical protein
MNIRKKTAWVGVWLVATGCATPGTRTPLQPSDSEAPVLSGSGDSSNNSDQSDDQSTDQSSDNSSEDSSEDSSEGTTRDSNNSSDASSDATSDPSQSSDNSSEGTSENSKNDTRQHSGSSESTHDNPALSAVVVGGTLVGIGVIIWQAMEQAARRAPPPAPKEVARAALLYLRGHAHQLREDLALGAGPALEDLAAMAHIRREHLGVFGQILRAHRHELLAILGTPHLTPELAQAWLRRVGELARTDPRLEEDREAFLSTYTGQDPPPDRRINPPRAR